MLQQLDRRTAVTDTEGTTHIPYASHVPGCNLWLSLPCQDGGTLGEQRRIRRHKREVLNVRHSVGVFSHKCDNVPIVPQCLHFCGMARRSLL